MISRIANAYLFRGSIGRAEFIITVLAALLLVRLTSSFVIDWFDVDAWLFDYSAMIVIGLYVAILLLPLFVARLKDIRWSPFFALLVLAPTAPLLAGQFSSGDGVLGGSTPSGIMIYSGLSNLLGLCLLLFTIVLAVMPTRQPTLS